MRKIYKISIACLISLNIQAQTQLSNASFENWELDKDNKTLVATDWAMPGACFAFTGNPYVCAYTAKKGS